MRFFTNSIRWVNNILSIALICLSVFLLLFWLIPEISIAVAQNDDTTEGYVYKSSAALKNFKINTENLKPVPIENRIVIPKIYVDGEIFEGESEQTLNKGFWRRPNTNNPSKGGNTVIAGHRFQYSQGPNTFYHLDKMNIEDEIIVFWEGKEYLYEVTKVFEVFPNDTYIEEDTSNSIITIYTCTPIYTAEKRLVVQAELV